MERILVVALREFRQRVRSRGFLFSAIGTPLILIAVWFGTGLLSPSAPEQPADLGQIPTPGETIGYVDQADLIHTIPAPVPADAYRAYPDTAAADQALASGEIGAYYIIPANYRDTGDVQRVSLRFPATPPETRTIDWILVRNILADDNSERAARLFEPFAGAAPRFVSLSAEAPQRGGTPMLPFIVTIAVLIPLFTGGTYLLQSLTQEKGNRVMEILLVSLRPRQLLAGKLIGLGALTLVQYTIWVAIGFIGLTVTGTNSALLQSAIRLSVGEGVVTVAFALGGFTLYAALMSGVGALSPDLEGSRAWIFVLTLPVMLPIYLWMPIANAPDGTLAVVLSLFPYSAPAAMLLRMTSTTVPAWQIGTSLALLVLGSGVTVWLMARLFRVQTLLSGEPFSIGRMLHALVAPQAQG
jgi:ABC-2 type transport system permease protein